MFVNVSNNVSITSNLVCTMIHQHSDSRNWYGISLSDCLRAT